MWLDPMLRYGNRISLPFLTENLQYSNNSNNSHPGSTAALAAHRIIGLLNAKHKETRAKHKQIQKFILEQGRTLLSRIFAHTAQLPLPQKAVQPTCLAAQPPQNTNKFNNNISLDAAKGDVYLNTYAHVCVHAQSCVHVRVLNYEPDLHRHHLLAYID